MMSQDIDGFGAVLQTAEWDRRTAFSRPLGLREGSPARASKCGGRGGGETECAIAQATRQSRLGHDGTGGKANAVQHEPAMIQ